MSLLVEAIKREVATEGNATARVSAYPDYSDYSDYHDEHGWADNWNDGIKHEDAWEDRN